MNQTANLAQLTAIQSPLTPQLVIAGAGSGKTFVLTERIIYLVKEKGLDPNRILAITFTNKAANEMSERIKSSLNVQVDNIKTIHSMCWSLLTKKIDVLGYLKNFSVLNPKRVSVVIKRLTRNYDRIPSKKLWNNSALVDLILEYKIKRIKPDDISVKEICDRFKDTLNILNKSEFHQVFVGVYNDYLTVTKNNNYVDFDDLLLLADDLLSITDVQQYWSNKFDAIVIDEFHDTDPIQWSIIKKMLLTHNNIFAVGDPDQSIYEWRRALPSIFNDFINNFPNTQIHKLEQNYRSTPQILSAANELIEHNRDNDNLSKVLYTKREDSDKVIFSYFDDVNEEVDWIINKIKELKENDQSFSYGDVAILYRINAISVDIEQKLVDNKIDYQILAGKSFYEIKEISALLGYLHLYLDDDDISIDECINVPYRYITHPAQNRLTHYALQHNLTLYQAMVNVGRIRLIPIVSKYGIERFVSDVENIRKQPLTTFRQLVEKIIEITDFYQGYDKRSWKDNQRIEYINAFKNNLDHYQKYNPNSSLQDYLDSVALFLGVTDNSLRDKDKTIAKDKVNLMTVHGSKGLEFKYVFLMRVSDGLLPFYKEFSYNYLKQERRLMYVGMTRAKNKLFISGSDNDSYQKWIMMNPYYHIIEKAIKSDSKYKTYFLSEIRNCPDILWH